MAQYPGTNPWASEPWTAFDELRRDMDALLGRIGTRGATAPRGVFPATNLYEASEDFILTAELPGVKPDEIEISLEGRTVTLRGERKLEAAAEGTSAHRRERQAGQFRRAFDLPVDIDANKAQAVHKNGVLMLRLPKAAEHQPRQISVQSG